MHEIAVDLARVLRAVLPLAQTELANLQDLSQSEDTYFSQAQTAKRTVYEAQALLASFDAGDPGMNAAVAVAR